MSVHYLCLFQIWPFFTNNVGQQLIFQAFTCDRKVYKGGLRLHLGFVMWIGQFGVKDEAEFWVILNFLVTHLDVPERQRVVHLFTFVLSCSSLQVWSETERNFGCSPEGEQRQAFSFAWTSKHPSQETQHLWYYFVDQCLRNDRMWVKVEENIQGGECSLLNTLSIDS